MSIQSFSGHGQQERAPFDEMKQSIMEDLKQRNWSTVYTIASVISFTIAMAFARVEMENEEGDRTVPWISIIMIIATALLRFRAFWQQTKTQNANANFAEDFPPTFRDALEAVRAVAVKNSEAPEEVDKMFDHMVAQYSPDDVEYTDD